MQRIFLIALVLSSFLSANAQSPAVTIPDFNFEKQDGSVFAKKNLSPGSLSFFVFFDTECDHCQHAITYLNEHQPQLAKAKLYLITLDSREKVKPFLDKYAGKLKKAKNTLLLFDTKDQFITRFGPRKYPSLMLYSKEGKLLLYDDDEKNLPKFIEKIKA